MKGIQERYEDTPELFGRGSGMSTCGDFKCAICGTVYNHGNDENEHYEDEPIIYTDFAGVQICGDCFGVVESEIIQRLPDIIPWFRRVMASEQERMDQVREALSGLGGGKNE